MSTTRSLDILLRSTLAKGAANQNPLWQSKSDTGLWKQCIDFLVKWGAVEPGDILSDMLMDAKTIQALQAYGLEREMFEHPPGEAFKRSYHLRRNLIWKAQRQVERATRGARACHYASLHCKAAPDTALNTDAALVTARDALDVLPEEPKYRQIRLLLETFTQEGRVMSTAEIAKELGVLPQSVNRPLEAATVWLCNTKQTLADLYDFRCKVLQGAA